jgi:hypothetical protein
MSMHDHMFLPLVGDMVVELWSWLRRMLRWVVEVDFWNCLQKTKDNGSHKPSPRLVNITLQSSLSDALLG